MISRAGGGNSCVASIRGQYLPLSGLIVSIYAAFMYICVFTTAVVSVLLCTSTRYSGIQGGGEDVHGTVMCPPNSI